MSELGRRLQRPAALRSSSRISPMRTQALVRPGATATSGGVAARQTSCSPRAARCERAAVCDLVGLGHRALEWRPAGASATVSRRLREQEPQRVGMERLLLERLGARPASTHRARVEHVDAVAQGERHAQVVRDQDQAHPARVLQRLEQREDLLLRRHVKRRGGLVGDQEVRVAGERRGDSDALAHAARELERIAVDDRGSSMPTSASRRIASTRLSRRAQPLTALERTASRTVPSAAHHAD